MMRTKILLVGVATAALALGLTGCGSSSGSAASGDAAPKGAPPEIVKAPPGTLTPEERGAQHNGPPGATTEPQDGGGQDSK